MEKRCRETGKYLETRAPLSAQLLLVCKIVVVGSERTGQILLLHVLRQVEDCLREREKVVDLNRLTSMNSCSRGLSSMNGSLFRRESHDW